MASPNKTTIMLYALKAIRTGTFYISSAIAMRIVQDQYLVKVYASREYPPSLLAQVGYTLLIDVVVNIVILALLGMSSYALNPMSQGAPGFVLSPAFIKAAAIDAFVTSGAVAVLSGIVAYEMMRKKYFRYGLEGPRAIRALREIMMNFFIAIVLLPTGTFFMGSDKPKQYMPAVSVNNMQQQAPRPQPAPKPPIAVPAAETVAAAAVPAAKVNVETLSEGVQQQKNNNNNAKGPKETLL